MSQIITISIDDEIKKNPELKKSDVDDLKEWCKTQPHLPELSETELVIFLHASYYLVESTKTLIEYHYTMRTHTPEFFANRDPLANEDLRKTFHVISAVPLKQLSKDGYHVFLVQITDPDASKFVYNDYIKFITIASEVFVYSTGIMKGLILLFDLQNFSMGHIPRVNLTSSGKCINYLQSGMPVRVKGLHYMNTNMAMNIVLNIVKPFMDTELAEMIHLHSTLESLNEILPIEALPNELGGKAGPLLELQKAEIEKLESHRDWIVGRESLACVDESKRLKQ